MALCRHCGREMGMYHEGEGLCVSCWRAAHPGELTKHEKNGQDILKLIKWITIGPFWLLWKLRKPIGWCCRKIGRICWVVGMNKWCWTIFSGGFAWLAYRLLKYVYEKKH